MTKQRRGAYPVTITRVDPVPMPQPNRHLLDAALADGPDPSAVTVIRPGLLEVTVR